MDQKTTDADVRELLGQIKDEINHVIGSQVITCRSAHTEVEGCKPCEAEAGLRSLIHDCNNLAQVPQLLASNGAQSTITRMSWKILQAREVVKCGQHFTDQCSVCYESACLGGAERYLDSLRRPYV